MAKVKRTRVASKDLLETIKQLVRRRDVRRVCLLSEEERLLEIPVNIGDPAAPATALRAPVVAAINAFATFISDCVVEVEHHDKA